MDIRTKELRASEKNFKNLYKIALAGLYRVSIDGGKLYSANPAYAMLFGYETDWRVIENMVPKEFYADPRRREELVEILFKEGYTEAFEFLGKRLDGTTRHFLLNAFLYEDEGYI